MTVPIIISFYTVNTPYEKEVENLRKSLKKWGLRSEIRGLDPQKNWNENCAMKGPFVRDLLHELKEPVLWVDADARIEGPLTWFEEQEWDFDLAAYALHSIRHKPPGLKTPKAPIQSGTVFVNWTEGGRILADAWSKECQAKPGRWDQRSLAVAWFENRKQVRFRLLPQGYCKVSDRVWRCPEEDRTPVIVHYQASRRFKRKVQRGSKNVAGHSQRKRSEGKKDTAGVAKKGVRAGSPVRRPRRGKRRNKRRNARHKG